MKPDLTTFHPTELASVSVILIDPLLLGALLIFGPLKPLHCWISLVFGPGTFLRPVPLCLGSQQHGRPLCASNPGTPPSHHDPPWARFAPGCSCSCIVHCVFCCCHSTVRSVCAWTGTGNDLSFLLMADSWKSTLRQMLTLKRWRPTWTSSSLLSMDQLSSSCRLTKTLL